MEISLRSGEFIRPLGSCDTDRPRVSCYSFSREVALRAVKTEEEGPHKKYTSPVVNNWEEVFCGSRGILCCSSCILPSAQERWV